MKKIVLSLSALTVAIMLGVSFYATLFIVFQYNFLLGFSILAFFILLIVLIMTDAELIQEIEE